MTHIKSLYIPYDKGLYISKEPSGVLTGLGRKVLDGLCAPTFLSGVLNLSIRLWFRVRV